MRRHTADEDLLHPLVRIDVEAKAVAGLAPEMTVPPRWPPRLAEKIESTGDAAAERRRAPPWPFRGDAGAPLAAVARGGACRGEFTDTAGHRQPACRAKKWGRRSALIKADLSGVHGLTISLAVSESLWCLWPTAIHAWGTLTFGRNHNTGNGECYDREDEIPCYRISAQTDFQR